MDGLLTHTAGSFQSKVELIAIGLEPLFEILLRTPVSEVISNLASSILLSLVSEGIFENHLELFLEKCIQQIDVLQEVIQIPHPVKTIENLVIIIQKISKTSVLSLEFTKIIESIFNLHLSDFCDLNLKSILSKIN